MKYLICNDSTRNLPDNIEYRDVPIGQTIRTLRKRMRKDGWNVKNPSLKSIRDILNKNRDSLNVKFAVDNFEKPGVDFSDWTRLINIGFNVSSMGLPYYELYGGADDQEPLVFIIYYDGSKLNVYVPIIGNTVNSFTNSCFEENSNGIAYEEELYIKDYRKEEIKIYDPNSSNDNDGVILIPDQSMIDFDIDHTIRQVYIQKETWKEKIRNWFKRKQHDCL